MGDWSEEGRIRLDEHAVRGEPLGRILQVPSVLEGHDPGKGDVEAQIESLSSQIRRAGEAMEHSGDATFPHCLPKDLGRVFLGVASVNDERKPALARRIDVRLEALVLRPTLRIVVMIVEPALADGDHTRM